MKGWVLVTRPEEEVVALSAALATAGFELVPFPVLREEPVFDPEGWERVRARLDTLALLFFTSARAPRRFRDTSQSQRLWSRLAALPAAAVGPATAAACRLAGLSPVHVGTGGGEELATQVARELAQGAVVLHPTSPQHRQESYVTFAAADVELLPLFVYRMVEAERDALPPLPPSLPAAVLLTSPRAAVAWARLASREVLAAPHFALGTTTAEAAASVGAQTRILPRPDPLLLVEELCQI